jgi:hypothetical protein
MVTCLPVTGTPVGMPTSRNAIYRSEDHQGQRPSHAASPLTWRKSASRLRTFN